MTELEDVVRAELERAVPEPAFSPDWADALERAGHRSVPRRTLLVIGAIAVAALVALGAMAASDGGFSAWLTGSPGKPAPAEEAKLRASDERSQARFPYPPSPRELIRVEKGGNSYTLYGFRDGNAVCLRLVGKGTDPGVAMSCASTSELERAADPVLVLRANVPFGERGRCCPTVPKALATFGFVGASIRRVDVVGDEGPSMAALDAGAFLAVIADPSRGTWARRITAVDAQQQRHELPIFLAVEGEPTGIPRRAPTGPGRVERRVANGTIGWVEREEPRGVSLAESNIQLTSPPIRIGRFARVITPDPDDFLRMVVAKGVPGRTGTAGICTFLVDRGGISGGCAPQGIFRRSPLSITGSGFSGAGSQQSVISGLVSDDVARVVLFLADGSQRPAPLRDNAVIVRAPLGLFPVRVAAYDAAGRVIGLSTLPSPRDF